MMYALGTTNFPQNTALMYTANFGKVYFHLLQITFKFISFNHVLFISVLFNLQLLGDFVLLLLISS